jgi:hypothetical protein
MSEYVTKSGRVLNDADIEALADEAEKGYDIPAQTPEEFEEQVRLSIELLNEVPKAHPCGLSLTLTERQAFEAVPPARVTFKSRDGEHGDIFLDFTDTGWGSRADAERAAVYFGTVVIDVEGDPEPTRRY